MNNSRIIENDLDKSVRNNVYLGPKYSENEIREFLDSKKISYNNFLKFC